MLKKLKSLKMPDTNKLMKQKDKMMGMVSSFRDKIGEQMPTQPAQSNDTTSLQQTTNNEPCDEEVMQMLTSRQQKSHNVVKSYCDMFGEVRGMEKMTELREQIEKEQLFPLFNYNYITSQPNFKEKVKECLMNMFVTAKKQMTYFFYNFFDENCKRTMMSILLCELMIDGGLNEMMKIHNLEKQFSAKIDEFNNNNTSSQPTTAKTTGGEGCNDKIGDKYVECDFENQAVYDFASMVQRVSKHKMKKIIDEMTTHVFDNIKCSPLSAVNSQNTTNDLTVVLRTYIDIVEKRLNVMIGDMFSNVVLLKCLADSDIEISRNIDWCVFNKCSVSHVNEIIMKNVAVENTIGGGGGGEEIPLPLKKINYNKCYTEYATRLMTTERKEHILNTFSKNVKTMSAGAIKKSMNSVFIPRMLSVINGVIVKKFNYHCVKMQVEMMEKFIDVDVVNDLRKRNKFIGSGSMKGGTSVLDAMETTGDENSLNDIYNGLMEKIFMMFSGCVFKNAQNVNMKFTEFETIKRMLMNKMFDISCENKTPAKCNNENMNIFIQCMRCNLRMFLLDLHGNTNRRNETFVKNARRTNEELKKWTITGGTLKKSMKSKKTTRRMKTKKITCYHKKT